MQFRRSRVPPNAAYTCPKEAPPPFCLPYLPMGSRVTVEVHLDNVDRFENGGIAAGVTLIVDKRDGDPETAQTGRLSGTISGVVVNERLAESNLQLLDLVPAFNLPP